MKLSLGPNLYYWSREVTLDFYKRVADAPVEIVYLGEVVCSKRRALRSEDWLEIADALAAAGKEVVLSTLALIEAESELGATRRLTENGRFPVEANEMGAVNMLAGRAKFVAGPHVNTYNAATLGLLADAGAKRWVAPVELGRDVIAALHTARPAGMETEVFVFGRLPLAFSARCFTARNHNTGKDDCGFRCGDFADGMMLSTQENKAFLVLNGIQTQSAETCNLVEKLPEMKRLGIDVVRISPQSRGTFEIIDAFRGVLDGDLDIAAAEAKLQPFLPHGACNGYWLGKPGMDWAA